MSNNNKQVHDLLKPNKKVKTTFELGDIIIWSYRKYTVGLPLKVGFYTKEDPRLFIFYNTCRHENE